MQDITKTFTIQWVGPFKEPWIRKPADIFFMDDVLIHETEEKIKRTLVAKLKSVRW